MEAFLHAKPLSTDWREMPSALDGGRRSPVFDLPFKVPLIRSQFARQPARTGCLQRGTQGSASEDGKRNPYACTEVVQTLDRYWDGTPAGVSNLVPPNP